MASAPQDNAKVQTLVVALVVFALAMVMGLPAVRGTFVGGDDHRLVLNHVLVNQPSLRHAAELFTIVHRDLYQPIPLLTFQLEFLVADWLNLFAKGVERGAWLFHFDNMWLHGVNALLVAAVVAMLLRRNSTGDPSKPSPLRRLHIRKRFTESPAGELSEPADDSSLIWAVAWTTALIFAVHPLQVEVVAWINGRMMLLSTLFALCAMLTFSRWLNRATWWAGLLTVLLVALSGISKVRVGLPILLAIVPFAAGRRLDRRFWCVWTPCALLIGGLAVLNVWTTAEADFFSGGAQHLQGPRAVRVLLALAFYFEHFVWPVGLSSYYPAPLVVTWTDASAIRAALTVLCGLIVLVYSSWKYPACRFAAIWFFAGIGDTLPFVPARNILAADRYMYLPIIGLAWIAGTLGCAGYRRLCARSATTTPQTVVAMTAVLFIPMLVAVCWRTAEGYTTAQAQALRIAQLFPEEPRVWERLGWTYHRAGDYDSAIKAGERELTHDTPDVRSGAYQLMGLSELKRGHVVRGLEHLHKALEIDADAGLAHFRLGMAYDELGRFAEAADFYEKALEAAPLDNPTIRRLARVYRRLDRIGDARAAYAKALANNRYDVDAALGLAELAIETGDKAELVEAQSKLADLLVDVDDPRLRANLGMVQFLTDQADENMKLAAAAFMALSDGRYAQAAERVERLANAAPSATEAKHWLLAQFERFDAERSGDPWTFALSTRLLISDGQIDAAKVALGLVDTLCRDAECRAYAARLRQQIPNSTRG